MKMTWTEPLGLGLCRRLGVWGCLVCSAAGVCLGQQPPTSDSIPTLPETQVIGEPPAMTAPETVFAPTEDFSALPPPVFTQSTVFGTPSVRGYLAPEQTTGTLLRVPDLELPAAVGVITSDTMRDQQATRMDEVLRDVSGVSKLGDQLRPDAFVLRGFEVRSRDYRKNGLLDPTYAPRNFANVERIEILKGPSSVLYGAGQPSGTVNLITKKPLATDYHRATAQFGSFGFERYTVDTTGPIRDDESWLYRLNFSYENADTFRDYGYNERVFLAPVVTWQIDADTALTWEGEYLQDRRRFDTGVVALDGAIGRVPITNFLGEPDNDFQLFQDWRQTLFFDHRLNEIWTTRIAATTIFYYAPSFGTFPLEQQPNTTLVDRSQQSIPQFFEQYYGVTANLGGEFTTGALEHKLVLGTEQGWFISNNFTSESSIPGLQNYTIDALQPVYLNPPGLLLPAVFDATYRQNRHGFYVQDLIKLNPRWWFMAGLRYDHADVTFFRELTTFKIPTIPPTDTEQGFDRWTPRVGVLYQPLPDLLSLYGSYSRSFDPPGGGARLTDDPLLPELGEAWEVGAKYQLHRKLAAQAAWFWIQKDNYTIDTVLSTPPFFATSQVGQQTSQGAEFSLVGQITDRWSTTSNYTITDAVLRDPTNADLDDRRPRNVPRHIVNLWTRYNVVQNSDHTLGAALGMVYVDDRLASFGGDLRLPDFTRWDAAFFYTRRRWDFGLYLENLFDKAYYSGSVTDFQITPGAPFTIRGQAGVTF
uniref:TonB-dependent siderophore receptor n=1 Tax=Schlesneria paludicola TaxID=360056 RepID=A0A7C4LKQ9_9PLAN